MTQTESLPRWQLDSLFPGLNSAEFTAAKSQLRHDVTALETFMDAHAISQEATQSGDEVIPTVETLLARMNELSTRFSDVRAFLYGHIATNAFDEEAQAEFSSLRPLSSQLSTLSKRATGWLGRLDHDLLSHKSEVAHAHAYALKRAALEAEHLMADPLEALVSELTQTGSGAWGKLHSDLSSRGSVRKTLPGKAEDEYTISQLKILQGEADETLREAAYRAELELLSQYDVAYAAAMNSIKGEANTLATRRGWPSVLDKALSGSHISAKSLAAMHEACREAFPMFRRYLKAKARLLGKETLAWYDLSAPISQSEQRYSWDEAKRFIVTSFASYSDKLAAFAQHSFDSGWHDAPPRKGKQGGAFCMAAIGTKESRVLLNFGGKLDDLFTLAHELGHAYHNLCKFESGRTPLQQQTPMTLAETASIFCETIVVNAALAEAEEGEKLAILEQDLMGATQLVVDIHSRFLFEKTVLERRQTRELAVSELNDIMLGAQTETYGEGLDPALRHPYMWAQKGHYYGRDFYNYPYTFGYLFGLGLYARYLESAGDFHARYDDLLASTGLDDAAPLAARFGIDIEDPAFWRKSLEVAAQRVQDYEVLAGAR